MVVETALRGDDEDPELLRDELDEDTWLDDGEDERLEEVETRLVVEDTVMVEILVVVMVLELLPCDEDEDAWLEDGEVERLEELDEEWLEGTEDE